MDSVEYLKADHIVRYHTDAIEQYGVGGVRSEHALYSAVMQPQQSAFGEDLYPTIPEKAAAYGFFLTQGHPFTDGNKRTAVVAMLAFLDLNGYLFDQPDDEITEMFVQVAAGAVQQGEFFRWVQTYATRLDEGRVLPFEQKS